MQKYAHNKSKIYDNQAPLNWPTLMVTDFLKHQSFRKLKIIMQDFLKELRQDTKINKEISIS